MPNMLQHIWQNILPNIWQQVLRNICQNIWPSICQVGIIARLPGSELLWRLPGWNYCQVARLGLPGWCQVLNRYPVKEALLLRALIGFSWLPLGYCKCLNKRGGLTGAVIFVGSWARGGPAGPRKCIKDIGIPYQMEDNKAAPSAPPLWVLLSSTW